MEQSSHVNDQPVVEQSQPSSPDKISHVDFSHVLTAFIFLVLGILITLVVKADDDAAEQKLLIEQAVAAAFDGHAEGVANNQTSGQPSPNNPVTRVDVSTDDDPFLGPADAPIVMIEFSDFNCPYCERFSRETLPPLLENYDGKVRYVYRDFPILGDSSVQAAFAAECANEQDAFWKYHDLLFENQGNLDQTLILNLAKELELDIDQFAACLDNTATRDEVFADYSDGQGLDISGTPTFFINGRRISGAQPYEVFQNVIDEELSAAGEASFSNAP